MNKKVIDLENMDKLASGKTVASESLVQSKGGQGKSSLMTELLNVDKDASQTTNDLHQKTKNSNIPE